MDLSEQEEQIRATTSTLSDILGDNLVAVWLHGSAVTGKLRPRSDIDLMAVVEHELTENQRRDLLRALLNLSAPHPKGPGDPRCLEVTAFRKADLVRASTSARAEFIYGEWLRKAFEAGERLDPIQKPDNTLILEQARRMSTSLYGPAASEILLEIPMQQVRLAMQEAIPELMDGLHGDERNVLLTLARMWHTASVGTFVSKDQAAGWAIPQIQERDAATLDLARRGYLGEVVDDWSCRAEAAQRLAAHLSEYVTNSL